MRRVLGCVVLTPLNKHAPPAHDARPVKAEDFDTSSWCQAFARKLAPIVAEHTGPQQLGIGVRGGIELYIHGLKIHYEIAVRDGVEVVFIKIDVVNAHNSFPRALAQQNLIDRAKNDPRLIPLAVACESTLRAHNKIYTRSRENASGFVYLCDSESGGGQGNALTGIIYAANQDPALKATEAAFPGVEVKAIHDDITLEGPPARVWGEGGALAFLVDQLKNRGLTVNQNKFTCLGSTPTACADKPSSIQEATSIQDKDGRVPGARGLVICENPIGEEGYVRVSRQQV